MGIGKIAAFIAALITFLPAAILRAGTAEDFFTVRGDDPLFAEVMKSGKLPRGKNSTTGFKGSTVRINHDLLKDSPDARRKIPDAIKIHTLGNSAINRRDFPNWTRWYQEDGNTQVFRLFKGEENVRNNRELAARIEAFSEVSWGKGGWHEWVGTYTIIKPHSCAIFQSKNKINDWSLQLNMSDSGDITLNHRNGTDKVIARNMVAKPFHVRVRDNGHDYEVFLNGKEVGKGEYARPAGETNFRWGMYLGGKPVRHDAMILVTGAGIDIKYDAADATALLREEEEKPAGPVNSESPDPDEENGLRIPERDWTNKDGHTIRAVALYEPGADHIRIRTGGKWVAYPLENLSDKTRKEFLLSLDLTQ